MNLSLYPKPYITPSSPAVERYRALIDGKTTQGPVSKYGAAFDVWRTQSTERLWSSYDGRGQDLREWVAKNFGDDVDPNPDGGPFACYPVKNIDMWPIPRTEDLTPGLSMQNVVDIMAGLFAVANGKADEATELRLPTSNTLTQRHFRTTESMPFVVATLWDGEIAVRAVSALHDQPEAVPITPPQVIYAATYEAPDGLHNATVSVDASKGDKREIRAAVRAAKKAFGLTGEAMQQHYPSMPVLVWLARDTDEMRLTLERGDDATGS